MSIILIILALLSISNISFSINYSEFSKKILKKHVYEKYKKDADNGNIVDIMEDISRFDDLTYE